jgi:hypothetical protein
MVSFLSMRNVNIVCENNHTSLRDINTSIRCFIMFSMITNIYNNKVKGPTLVELFTATGKLKKGVFDN